MLIEILILIAAIPLGFLITRHTQDELKSGKIWFILTIIACIILGVWFYIVEMKYVVLTLGFILIISIISLVESYNMRGKK